MAGNEGAVAGGAGDQPVARTSGVIGNIIRDLACLPKGWLQ